MRELSLFSGAGGGLLGTKLLGFTHVGYVEYDDYCQRVIRQRIEDGILDHAPIFGDIKTFISDGYAESYQGLVDIITAGFPCQPFSIAGKQAGENDERNMWTETIDVIRRVRPKYALLENVPGLLNPVQRWLVRLIPKNPGWFRRIAFKTCFPSYFGRVLGDLAESGFDAKWCVLGADDVGSQHRRKRIWIVANSISARQRSDQNKNEKGEWFTRAIGNACIPQNGTDAHKNGLQRNFNPQTGSQGTQIKKRCEVGRTFKTGTIANSKIESGNVSGNYGENRTSEKSKPGNGISQKHATNSIGMHSSSSGETGRMGREKPIQGNGYREITSEPFICRGVDVVAHRVDKLKSLGNGQVPAVVATAWRILTGS